MLVDEQPRGNFFDSDGRDKVAIPGNSNWIVSVTRHLPGAE